MNKGIISKVVLLVLSLGVIGASVGVGLNTSKSEIKVPVTFVATDTSSGYDATIKVGNYNYKFRGSIDSDSNKFVLTGTALSRASASSGNNQGGPGGQGGFGGGGFGGGGFGGNTGGQPGGQDTPATPVESISISLDKTTAYINEQVKATVTALPEGASTSVDWSSSDETIAKVSSGTITPLKAGTVTITATSQSDKTKTATATLVVEEEDLTQYNYTLKGTYELTDGYGYILNLDDENKTVIHADYNKTEGRHEFYYTVKIGEASSFIKFQAKEANYKTAKGYKTWDVRDSKYIFTSLAKGNNSSVAYAYMYLHTDGSVVINTPSGVNRVVTTGLTWTEDAENNITVTNGNQTYTSLKTLDGKGYKIDYGSYTFLNSQNPDKKWKQLGAPDFFGVPQVEFAGRYEISGPGGSSGYISIQLFDGGVAKIYQDTWTLKSEGTWTEADGVYTINMGENTYVSQKVDGEDAIIYHVSAKTPWGSDASADFTLPMVK